MNRIYIILCAAILLTASCHKVEPLTETHILVGPQFTASVEDFGAESKTALSYGNSVVWSSEDQIAVFQGTSVADKYQINENYVGLKNGTFSIAANGEGTSTSSFLTNIALYPYIEDLTCTPVMENGAITSYRITGATIPSIQNYTPESFPDESFLMAAITATPTEHTLNFRNLCGALELQLKGTAKVRTIELEGNNGEPLSGNATITVYPNSTTPALTMNQDASTCITLNWRDGVQLNNETATSFIISIPPTNFEKGFTVKVVDIMGAEAKIATSTPNAVKRSYIHTMPEVTVETVFSPVDESVLSGISIACIGNSITYGVKADGNPYPSQLAKRLNATVTNLGQSGTSLCEGGARTCNIGQLTETNCAGKDIVTIMMGINDWAAAKNNASDGTYYHLGNINSTETNCIYGAMHMWCKKIAELRNTENCAGTRFYFLTPLITSWNNSVTSTRDWDQSKTNVHGFTLRDLCHAIMDVATLYDIPVIDLNICSGIYYNSPTDENVSLYGGDGVHINEAGHTLVTNAIIRALAGDMEPKQNEMVDLFVFAGQSNMMGAAHLPPIDNPITTDSFEYKYQAVLKGGDKGEFVYAQNPAGDWHYINPDEAYGEQYLDVATGKSKLANYSSTMHFIPACRDQTKGFSSQSEHQNYPSATMAPYFAQYYSELGRKCIYAHMAKGSCKITHYFTEDAMEEYKLKLQALWSHLQTLGFTHFFILRVGFWGSVSVNYLCDLINSAIIPA